MKTILVTGFNAFGPVRVNPSELLLEKLPAGELRGVRLVTALLATEYQQATRQLKRLLRREKPAAVLCLGVAAGRREICLERIALNLDDEALPDNAGVVRRDRPIVRSGPPLYRSSLPLSKMLRRLQQQRIRARISNHAGTYLCNHVFYVLRHETRHTRIPAGFLHVPALRHGRKPGMSLRTMQRSLKACLEVLAAEFPSQPGSSGDLDR